MTGARNTPLLGLQRAAGNAAVSRSINSAGAVVQRRKLGDDELKELVQATRPQKNQSPAKYLNQLDNALSRKYKKKGQYDAEDAEYAKSYAREHWASQLGGGPAKKVPVESEEEQARRQRFSAFAQTGFTTLDADEAAGYYTLERSSTAKIRNESAEKDFVVQARRTVGEAVEQAISNLDLTGSAPAAYARHDFQPSGSKRVNLQVQLGGSKLTFHVGKGDSSATLVTIDQGLWNLMVKYAPARWKSVIQAAHRESFNSTEGISIGFGTLQ